MLETMNELDEIWSRKIKKAMAEAATAGRSDVADYLELRAANDALRQTSIKWLFDSLLEIAAFSNRNGTSITIETDNSHRFAFKNSTLVGGLARLRQGVRCLTVEGGWTRTPADGFMRGGALAIGRVSHFGLSKHNAELYLVLENDSPAWFSTDKDGERNRFDSRHLNEHFRLFLD